MINSLAGHAHFVVGGGEGQGSIALLLFFLLLAIGISFLCSILEAVLLSSSLSYTELSAEAGSRGARYMLGFKEDVERPISAILTLNTFAHTIGAAGVGAEAQAIFGEEWVTITSIILTILILVFSEIIPKTLGANYWKQLLVFAGYAIRVLVIGLFPLVWMFEKLTGLMRSNEESPTVTRAELEVMARIGSQEGELNADENLILVNMLRLRDLPVETIMTPRTVMLSLQHDQTIREVLDEYPSLPYSRIPVYDKTADDIDSYVLRQDIYKHAAEDEYSVLLKDIARKIHAVPETATVASTLKQFIERKEKDHLFLVIDEYGGTAGIITLEDTVETLLGAEIVDESDLYEDLREVAEERSRRSHAEDDDTFDNGDEPEGEPSES